MSLGPGTLIKLSQNAIQGLDRPLNLACRRAGTCNSDNYRKPKIHRRSADTTWLIILRSGAPELSNKIIQK